MVTATFTAALRRQNAKFRFNGDAVRCCTPRMAFSLHTTAPSQKPVRPQLSPSLFRVTLVQERDGLTPQRRRLAASRSRAEDLTAYRSLELLPTRP
eukprot:2202995-Prymnesium_polylepis.1